VGEKALYWAREKEKKHQKEKFPKQFFCFFKQIPWLMPTTLINQAIMLIIKVLEPFKVLVI
jgi:hypothetical protein